MAEGGVDDGSVRYAEHELLEPDAWHQLLLGHEAIVRGGVEIEDRLQLLIVGDRDEHAVAARGMVRRDQTVRVELPDEGDRRKPHQPARRASSRRRTVCMAGRPPRIM